MSNRKLPAKLSLDQIAQMKRSALIRYCIEVADFAFGNKLLSFYVGHTAVHPGHYPSDFLGDCEHVREGRPSCCVVGTVCWHNGFSLNEFFDSQLVKISHQDVILPAGTMLNNYDYQGYRAHFLAKADEWEAKGQ